MKETKELKGTEKKRKESLFSRLVKNLKNNSRKAKRATILLFVFILMGISTGIVAAYLFNPAKDIYVSESAFHKESRNVYDYTIDSDERAAQETKAAEAKSVYDNVMNKYTTDSNSLIAWYANLHSSIVKVLIIFGILLPLLAMLLMFIGQPKLFVFAVINIIIVAPVLAVNYLFHSFREEKNENKIGRRMEKREAV